MYFFFTKLCLYYIKIRESEIRSSHGVAFFRRFTTGQTIQLYFESGQTNDCFYDTSYFYGQVRKKIRLKLIFASTLRFLKFNCFLYLSDGP